MKNEYVNLVKRLNEAINKKEPLVIHGSFDREDLVDAIKNAYPFKIHYSYFPGSRWEPEDGETSMNIDTSDMPNIRIPLDDNPFDITLETINTIDKNDLTKKIHELFGKVEVDSHYWQSDREYPCVVEVSPRINIKNLEVKEDSLYLIVAWDLNNSNVI